MAYFVSRGTNLRQTADVSPRDTTVCEHICIEEAGVDAQCTVLCGNPGFRQVASSVLDSSVVQGIADALNKVHEAKVFVEEKVAHAVGRGHDRLSCSRFNNNCSACVQGEGESRITRPLFNHSCIFDAFTGHCISSVGETRSKLFIAFSSDKRRSM